MESYLPRFNPRTTLDSFDVRDGSYNSFQRNGEPKKDRSLSRSIFPVSRVYSCDGRSARTASVLSDRVVPTKSRVVCLAVFIIFSVVIALIGAVAIAVHQSFYSRVDLLKFSYRDYTAKQVAKNFALRMKYLYGNDSTVGEKLCNVSAIAVQRVGASRFSVWFRLGYRPGQRQHFRGKSVSSRLLTVLHPLLNKTVIPGISLRDLEPFQHESTAADQLKNLGLAVNTSRVTMTGSDTSRTRDKNRVTSAAPTVADIWRKPPPLKHKQNVVRPHEHSFQNEPMSPTVNPLTSTIIGTASSVAQLDVSREVTKMPVSKGKMARESLGSNALGQGTSINTSSSVFISSKITEPTYQPSYSTEATTKTTISELPQAKVNTSQLVIQALGDTVTSNNGRSTSNNIGGPVMDRGKVDIPALPTEHLNAPVLNDIASHQSRGSSSNTNMPHIFHPPRTPTHSQAISVESFPPQELPQLELLTRQNIRPLNYLSPQDSVEHKSSVRNIHSGERTLPQNIQHYMDPTTISESNRVDSVQNNIAAGNMLQISDQSHPQRLQTMKQQSDLQPPSTPEATKTDKQQQNFNTATRQGGFIQKTEIVRPHGVFQPEIQHILSQYPEFEFPNKTQPQTMIEPRSFVQVADSNKQQNTSGSLNTHNIVQPQDLTQHRYNHKQPLAPIAPQYLGQVIEPFHAQPHPLNTQNSLETSHVILPQNATQHQETFSNFNAYHSMNIPNQIHSLNLFKAENTQGHQVRQRNKTERQSTRVSKEPTQHEALILNQGELLPRQTQHLDSHQQPLSVRTDQQSPLVSHPRQYPEPLPIPNEQSLPGGYGLRIPPQYQVPKTTQTTSAKSRHDVNSLPIQPGSATEIAGYGGIHTAQVMPSGNASISHGAILPLSEFEAYNINSIPPTDVTYPTNQYPTIPKPMPSPNIMTPQSAMRSSPTVNIPPSQLYQPTQSQYRMALENQLTQTQDTTTSEISRQTQTGHTIMQNVHETLASSPETQNINQKRQQGAYMLPKQIHQQAEHTKPKSIDSIKSFANILEPNEIVGNRGLLQPTSFSGPIETGQLTPIQHGTIPFPSEYELKPLTSNVPRRSGSKYTYGVVDNRSLTENIKPQILGESTGGRPQHIQSAKSGQLRSVIDQGTRRPSELGNKEYTAAQSSNVTKMSAIDTNRSYPNNIMSVYTSHGEIEPQHFMPPKTNLRNATFSDMSVTDGSIGMGMFKNRKAEPPPSTFMTGVSHAFSNIMPANGNMPINESEKSIIMPDFTNMLIKNSDRRMDIGPTESHNPPVRLPQDLLPSISSSQRQLDVSDVAIAAQTTVDGVTSSPGSLLMRTTVNPYNLNTLDRLQSLTDIYNRQFGTKALQSQPTRLTVDPSVQNGQDQMTSMRQNSPNLPSTGDIVSLSETVPSSRTNQINRQLANVDIANAPKINALEVSNIKAGTIPTIQRVPTMADAPITKDKQISKAVNNTLHEILAASGARDVNTLKYLINILQPLSGVDSAKPFDVPSTGAVRARRATTTFRAKNRVFQGVARNVKPYIQSLLKKLPASLPEKPKITRPNHGRITFTSRASKVFTAIPLETTRSTVTMHRTMVKNKGTSGKDNPEQSTSLSNRRFLTSNTKNQMSHKTSYEISGRTNHRPSNQSVSNAAVSKTNINRAVKLAGRDKWSINRESKKHPINVDHFTDKIHRNIPATRIDQPIHQRRLNLRQPMEKQQTNYKLAKNRHSNMAKQELHLGLNGVYVKGNEVIDHQLGLGSPVNTVSQTEVRKINTFPQYDYGPPGIVDVANIGHKSAVPRANADQTLQTQYVENHATGVLDTNLQKIISDRNRADYHSKSQYMTHNHVTRGNGVKVNSLGSQNYAPYENSISLSSTTFRNKSSDPIRSSERTGSSLRSNKPAKSNINQLNILEQSQQLQHLTNILDKIKRINKTITEQIQIKKQQIKDHKNIANINIMQDPQFWEQQQQSKIIQHEQRKQQPRPLQPVEGQQATRLTPLNQDVYQQYRQLYHKQRTSQQQQQIQKHTVQPQETQQQKGIPFPTLTLPGVSDSAVRRTIQEVLDQLKPALTDVSRSPITTPLHITVSPPPIRKVIVPVNNRISIPAAIPLRHGSIRLPPSLKSKLISHTVSVRPVTPYQDMKHSNTVQAHRGTSQTRQPVMHVVTGHKKQPTSKSHPLRPNNIPPYTPFQTTKHVQVPHLPSDLTPITPSPQKTTKQHTLSTNLTSLHQSLLSTLRSIKKALKNTNHLTASTVNVGDKAHAVNPVPLETQVDSNTIKQNTGVLMLTDANRRRFKGQTTEQQLPTTTSSPPFYTTFASSLDFPWDAFVPGLASDSPLGNVPLNTYYDLPPIY